MTATGTKGMIASLPLILHALSPLAHAGSLPKSASPDDEGVVQIVLSSAAMMTPKEMWETLAIDSWKLSLRLPPDGAVVRRCDNSTTCLMLHLETISEIEDADGVCSTSRKEIALRQKEAIARARSDADARAALEIRTFSMSSLAGLTKNGGLKIVYGLQDCQGDMADDEPISWYTGQAASYLNDRAIAVRLAFKVDEKVLNKESAAYLEGIRLKKSRNSTRRWWEFFEQIVGSIKAVNGGKEHDR